MKATKYMWDKRSIEKSDPGYVHNVLSLGSVKDIKKMVSEVGINKVKEIFVKHPKKVYTPSSYNFVKNFLLKIKENLNKDEYLKTTLRNTRPRKKSTS